MKKFKTTENIVLNALQKNPTTRTDDFLLLLEVYKQISPQLLDYPFGEVIKNHNYHNIPNWGTITRTRRKLQKKYPELVDKKTKKAREKEEDFFIAYSKDKGLIYGNWKYIGTSNNGKTLNYMCSCCKRKYSINTNENFQFPKYCSNCGAKMI